MITIHQSAKYSAHLLNSSGLIIESNSKQGGVQLRKDHPQYGESVDALRTAIDSDEADALCRALIKDK